MKSKKIKITLPKQEAIQRNYSALNDLQTLINRAKICLLALTSLSLLSLSPNTEAAAQKIKTKNSSRATNKKAQPAKSPSASPNQTSKTAEGQTSNKEAKIPIKNEVHNCKTEVEIKDLVGNPDQWLNKEVCFSGVFNSFTGLALDYPAAMRDRKNYISVTLYRPKTQVPLGELKLAYKIEQAQRHELLPKIADGDEVKIKGKMFNTALGEPWLDIVEIKVSKNPANANKEDSEENPFEGL